MKPRYSNGLAPMRERSGLTQATVAAELGIAVATYQNYEWGKRDMPCEVAKKLSRLFRCDVREVMGMTQERGNEAERASDVRELVSCYLSCDETWRAQVLSIARAASRTMGASHPEGLGPGGNSPWDAL